MRSFFLHTEIEISFVEQSKIVRESAGEVQLSVQLSRPAAEPLTVAYHTVEGSAASETPSGRHGDFRAIQGEVLEFQPGERVKQISLKILDDMEHEDDETFCVQLSDASAGAKITLASCLVIIVDDDQPGNLSFAARFIPVTELDDYAVVTVCRTGGCAGAVSVEYETSDGVAKEGHRYEKTQGTLAFKHGETEKNIKVKLLPAEPQPNETFCISIKNPTGCHLGMINMAVVTIDEDAEVQAVERILKQHLERRAEAFEPDFYVAGSDIWAQQFADAILCGGTIDDNGKYIKPSISSRCMHLLCVFWKVMFATIPPTDYCSGWATFLVSLCWIGVLTAVIGDTAGQLGCALGISDLVTAITLVAMGTSLPDLLASGTAVRDKNYADAGGENGRRR